MTDSRLLILDVGHGNAAVYESDSSVAIIDGGPDHTLATYVERQSISAVDAIFVSHSDEDHLRGILLLLEGDPDLDVSAIYVNPAQQKKSDLWDAFAVELERLELAGTKVITALTRSSPGVLDLGHGRIEVLAPPPARMVKENRDNRWSAVLRVIYDDEPIATFCADIDAHAIRDLVSGPSDLTARILVFPHHGGGLGVQQVSDTVSALLGASSPELVLFSMGRARYDNPLPAVVASVRAVSSAKIACTQLSKRCSERVFRDRDVHASSAGDRSGLSCLGSLQVDLPLTGPLRTPGHSNFVEALLGRGETPQCK